MITSRTMSGSINERSSSPLRSRQQMVRSRWWTSHLLAAKMSGTGVSTSSKTVPPKDQQTESHRVVLGCRWCLLVSREPH